MKTTHALRCLFLAGCTAAALAVATAPARAQELPPELEDRYNAARADFDRAEPACDLATMQDALTRMTALDAEIEQIARQVRNVGGNAANIAALGALKSRVSGEAGRERILLDRCRREGPRRATAPADPAPIPSPSTGAPTTTAPVPSTSTGPVQVPPEGIGPRIKARFDAAVEAFRAAREPCDIARMRAALAQMEAARDQLLQLLNGLRAADVQDRRAVDALDTQALVMIFTVDDARRAVEQCLPPDQRRPVEPAPGPARTPGTAVSPTLSMKAFLDGYGLFEQARTRCDLDAMAVEIARLTGLLEAMRTALSQETNPARQEQRRAEIRAAEAIQEQARRERAERCPRPATPPPPPIETPVNPQPATEDVMQLPGQRQRPTYNASFGGTWLNDGDLDLGLAQATFEVDFPFDEEYGSGLGNARLGPRFRLIGELSTGIFDQSHETLGFRDSVGINFSAIGYGAIVLPIGDEDTPGSDGGFALFARLGYGFADFAFELTGPGVDFSDSDTSDFFAFGVGAEYFFDRRNGIRAGYTRWDDFEQDGISANLFGVSYVRRFGGGRR